MIQIKRLGCTFLLNGIAALMGYSQETGSEYVSPSEAVPKGKAPKMKVQWLNPGEATKQYAVIFTKETRRALNWWSSPRKLKPVHPGEILREEFIVPLGLSMIPSQTV